MKNVELYGHITDSGKPIISGLERFNHIFKSNPGKRFIIDISVIEPGTNDHHVWYIMKMIVPAVIRGNKELGLVMTPEKAVEFIIDECPIFYITSKKKHSIFDFTTWQPKCDMQIEELEIAIEWLHIYCLKNYDISIGNYKSL